MQRIKAPEDKNNLNIKNTSNYGGRDSIKKVKLSLFP